MQDKKNALFVSSLPWSDNNRGLIATLDELSKKYAVIIAARGGDFSNLRRRKVPCYHLSFGIDNRYLRWILTSNIILVPFFRLLYLVLKYSPVVLYLREPRLHPSAVLVRMLFPNIRYVLDVRENPSTHRAAQALSLKIFHHFVDEVRTISPYLKKHLQEYFLLENIIVKYALPASNFMASIREPVERECSPLKICFFGAIKPDRLVHYLVESVNRLPIHVVCDIYGKIASIDYKESLIKLNSNGVARFCGEIDYSSAPDKLVEYDCGILLNEINDNSKFTIPGKLWEYASCGLCIVSNNRPTVVNFIKSYKIGLLADAVDEIIESFLLLASDRELLKELKSNSKKFFQEIRNQQMLEHQ